MKVFKFGGASVKDSESVRNVAAILSSFKKDQVVVVVSAMGKTTNALENVVNAYMKNDPGRHEALDGVKSFHDKILNDLGFPADHQVRHHVNNCFVEIEWILEEPPARDYNYTYDQIVSQGEMISTYIVSGYLNDSGYKNTWLDARDVIRTDDSYREGRINWEQTSSLIQEKVPRLFNFNSLILTQGFIGSTSDNTTTTLGREGSDYTAAIFSFCLKATEMTVWKDVPGILSADPKFHDDTVKLEQISYHDAIELTYYGASVIHPKTIKPLENLRIPLRVCSFKSPQDKGTLIGDFPATKPLVPCFIFKTNQILISVSARDFSFIAEESLSRIFGILARRNVKVNLMQNSAISFSICADNDPLKIPGLIADLQLQFQVLYNDSLRLVTIRNYFNSTIDQMTRGRTILLEQRTRHTAQLIMKENG